MMIEKTDEVEIIKPLVEADLGHHNLGGSKENIMSLSKRRGVLFLLFLFSLLFILASCGETGETNVPATAPETSQSPASATAFTPATPAETGSPSGPVVITIGNLTDETGVASIPLSYIDISVRDMIDYYNEENIIPGVKLELLGYDTQFNPGKFISGYEWLRNHGADLIWNALPPGVTELQDRADEDEFCIFSATANIEPEELDGSHVFCIAITPKYEAYTFLDWIAKNDPDFPQGRPAKIGGAAWKEDYSNIWFEAAKEYCNAHPDKYEWVQEYLTEVKFSWDAEIHGLKDCDYIYVPTPPQTFLRAYRQAGYEAKFIGTELHVAFNGMIDANDLWEEANGMLLILAAGWYNDENDSTIQMINSLLTDNYSDEKMLDILTVGAAYRTALRIHMICDIIKQTVERVGAENFSTEALVETAKSWSFTYDNVEEISNFTETKRFSQNYYGIYEFSVDQSNPRSWEYVTRVDPDWIPQVTKP